MARVGGDVEKGEVIVGEAIKAGDEKRLEGAAGDAALRPDDEKGLKGCVSDQGRGGGADEAENGERSEGDCWANGEAAAAVGAVEPEAVAPALDAPSAKRGEESCDADAEAAQRLRARSRLSAARKRCRSCSSTIGRSGDERAADETALEGAGCENGGGGGSGGGGVRHETGCGERPAGVFASAGWPMGAEG